ncbi:hypothetical protein [Petroclostridium sp. X23]|uniref:hypothetical protein n=1 Tax=Petroclostridium sp. X23 TaxID=3045146 RepID=UPI0024AE0862|nr:hypothetical protein [Petroclostridium sp. X23]WHH60432.1 hypothetical protein QKW49_06825 [Petroclostridium sp. X23]
MNRVELYRRRKRNKRLLLFTILACFAVLVVGLITVDYAVNSMLGVNDEIKIATLVKTGDSIYEVNFMNCQEDINLSYLKKDWNRVTAWLNQYYERAGEYVLKISDYTKEVTNTK